MSLVKSSRCVVVCPLSTWCWAIWHFASFSSKEKPRNWLTNSNFEQLDLRSYWRYRQRHWGKEPKPEVIIYIINQEGGVPFSFGTWQLLWCRWFCRPCRLDESTLSGIYRLCWDLDREDEESVWSKILKPWRRRNAWQVSWPISTK